MGEVLLEAGSDSLEENERLRFGEYSLECGELA